MKLQPFARFTSSFCSSSTYRNRIFFASQRFMGNIKSGLECSKSSSVSSSLPRAELRNGKYINPWNPSVMDKSFTDMMNFVFNPKYRPPIYQLSEIDAIKPDLSTIHAFDGNGMLASWIGHSTILVQMDGLNFLTDPVWSQRCSPFQFFGPKRFAPPAINLEDLPKLDFVVISHNHYDHLDLRTVKKIGDCVTWFVPMGLASWFRACNIKNVVEMNWWEETNFKDFRIVCTPAQHWSSRTPFDRNETLWCSWTIIGPNNRFFFTGDTGYCSVFTEIGKQYGPFDLAAIPIGAYSPRWFMAPLHINPEEAVQIHKDLHAKKSFAIHWGTFPLTSEKLNDPPQELFTAANHQGLASDDFVTLKIGETWRKN